MSTATIEKTDVSTMKAWEILDRVPNSLICQNMAHDGERSCALGWLQRICLYTSWISLKSHFGLTELEIQRIIALNDLSGPNVVKDYIRSLDK